LVESVAVIAAYAQGDDGQPHHLMAMVPDKSSKVGRYLWDMGLPQMLQTSGLEVSVVGPAAEELGEDDESRQNLIPLTSVRIGRHHQVLYRIDQRVRRVFTVALPDQPHLVELFTAVVREAVDNMVDYGSGGVVAGLFYPAAGEVEITLANRLGGFGGQTPEEQRDALLTACAGEPTRALGGVNGLRELQQLAAHCMGTLMLRSGAATLYMAPDGTVDVQMDETDLPAPGAAVTILLHLAASASGRNAGDPEVRRAFEQMLRASVTAYLGRTRPVARP
jgi:hypothetical protein